MKSDQKWCAVCKSQESKYKCPACRAPYCSVACCKSHKASDECQPVEEPEEPVSRYPGPSTNNVAGYQHPTEETVPPQLLERLGESDDLKSLLHNPHLQAILKLIDSSEDPKTAMEDAMQEPLFVEFANECLRVVDPPEDGDSLPKPPARIQTDSTDQTALIHSLLKTALAPYNSD